MRADVVVDVQLAVTEAASNAVRHSGCSSFQVEGWVDGRSLVVCVWDRGAGVDEANPGFGVGLEIIRGVARTVDVEHTSPGTRITMQFDQRADDDIGS